MKNKICFVATSLGAGGAERNISILANSFVKRGYSVYIILLFSNNVFYKLDSRINIIDFSLNKNNFLNIFKWSKKIRYFIKKEKIRNVVSVGIKFGLITAFGLRKRDQINLIVRGSSTCKLSKFIHVISHLVGCKITTFVSQTKKQGQFLPKNLLKKVVYISNPFELQTENKNFDKGYFSKRFVCVARLNVDQKKQDMILKAFCEFQKKYNEYSLDFYGSDRDGVTRDKLIALSKEMKLSNVNFIGECLDVHNKIIPSTAFICCSSFEGMPNALIESMLLGIPVISSNWQGVDEIIQDGWNGFIFGDCNDYISLSNAMVKVAELNKIEYEKLSEKTYSFNRESYDSEKILNKWEELFY